LRRARHPAGYRYQHHLGPLPVQQPHPPVLLGGTAAPALRRAGRLAQGWIGSSRHDLTEIGTYVETVRDGARAAGRDPQALRIVVRCLVDLVDLVDGDLGGRRLPLHGTREQVTSTGRPLTTGMRRCRAPANSFDRLTASQMRVSRLFVCSWWSRRSAW